MNERPRREKAEQPDEETVVYLLRGNSANKKYHYTEDCSRLDKSNRDADDRTEAEAKLWNNEPCRYCVLDDVPLIHEDRENLATKIRNGDYTIERK